MKYTKKEFAEACGMTTGNLSNYILKLKKVVLTDNMIDDSIAQNADFLFKRKDLIASGDIKHPKSSKKQTINGVSEFISLDNLFEKLNPVSENLSYNHAAEARAVEIMTKSIVEGNPFMLIPEIINYNNFSYQFIKAFETLMNREIQIRKISGAQLNEVVKFYSDLCQEHIQALKEANDEMVQELIAEYSETEKQ